MPGVNVKSMAGTFGRVDLTPAEYARLIEQKGYRATWEKATVCPHRSPNNPLVHDMNHQACDQGFLYYGAKDVRVLITGLSVNRQYMQTGKWDAGQAIITLAPENRISFQDKLTLHDATTRFYELLYRANVGVVDRPKYPVVSALDVRDATRAYVEGTDFQVDTSGNIVWLTNGQRPTSGSMYSLSYTHRVVYIVVDMAHDIRDTMTLSKTAPWPKQTGQELYAQLPVQGVARMHFLVRDQSLEAQSP